MALYTMNKVLRKPDYFDAVIKSVTHKTPLLTILKRGEKPTDWAQEVEVEPEIGSFQMAAAEGGNFDRTGLTARTNLVLKHQLQKFRSFRGWAVTMEAQEMPSHTESKGEKSIAREQRKDSQEVVLSMEHAFSSLQEAVERGTANNVVPKTRGLMCWLKPLLTDTDAAAALLHPVQPIPRVLCPRFGFTGDVTDASAFNEDVFKEMLQNMALQQGDDTLQLTMLAGLNLKSIMSSWLGKVAPVTGVDTNLIRTQSADAKKKSLICDIFEYDGATVRVVTDNHLCAVADASTKKYGVTTGRYSGALIRPEFWAVSTLIPLKNVDLPKEGDEVAGYHVSVQRLECRNPLAQGAIFHEVDSSSSSS